MATLPNTLRYAHLGAFKQGGGDYGDVKVAGGTLREGTATGATRAAGVYTLRVPLPARSYILDVGVTCLALWTAGSTALLLVGDDVTADGFFASTNLRATDLIVGETNNIEHPGGLAGAYIVSEQRLLYQDGPRSVIFKVTTTGTAAAAGVTACFVEYAALNATDATYVAT